MLRNFNPVRQLSAALFAPACVRDKLVVACRCSRYYSDGWHTSGDVDGTDKYMQMHCSITARYLIVGASNQTQPIASSLSVGTWSRASPGHLRIHTGSCTFDLLLCTLFHPSKNLIYRSGLHFPGRSCHHHSHRSICLGHRMEWCAAVNTQN